MTLKYQRGTPPEWTEGAKAFAVKEFIDEGVRKLLLSGPCPRCGHPISLDLTDRIGVGLAAASSKPIQVIVKCKCGMPHPGAPDGQPLGCGAQGVVSIKRE